MVIHVFALIELSPAFGRTLDNRVPNLIFILSSGRGRDKPLLWKGFFASLLMPSAGLRRQQSALKEASARLINISLKQICHSLLDET